MRESHKQNQPDHCPGSDSAPSFSGGLTGLLGGRAMLVGGKILLSLSSALWSEITRCSGQAQKLHGEIPSHPIDTSKTLHTSEIAMGNS